MAPFVAPSGGDWSAHVGGAVIFNGTVGCTLSASTIASVGGSGVAISGFNRGVTITGNELAWLGEGAPRRRRRGEQPRLPPLTLMTCPPAAAIVSVGMVGNSLDGGQSGDFPEGTREWTPLSFGAVCGATVRPRPLQSSRGTSAAKSVCLSSRCAS